MSTLSALACEVEIIAPDREQPMALAASSGLTRRSLFEIMLAFFATISLSPKSRLYRDLNDSVLVAEIVDDERSVIVHTRGTKLERFLRSRGVKPAHLARESGYSRQHLLRIRLGTMEPTRRCIVGIVQACRRLTREPVTAADLFEMEPGELRAIGGRLVEA